jgi:hypothetical protein
METRSLGMRKREIRNKHNELLLGNVLAMTCYPTYASRIPQQSGSLKVTFLTTPSSPTMTSDRPAQKCPPSPLRKFPGEIQQIFLDCASRTHSQFASRVYGGIARGFEKCTGSPLVIVCENWPDGDGVMS